MKFTTALFAAMFSFASAASAQMAVVPGGASSITYEMKSVLSSRKVLFNGAQNTPNYRDYFGLFRAGSETRLQWCYLDGTKVVDTNRQLASGACTFSNLAPGNYSARVYSAGQTTAPIASVLFTVDPAIVEYRTVPQEGMVTIERTHQGLVDKAVISRTGDGGVMTVLLDPATGLKQVKVSYSGETVTSNVPVMQPKAMVPGKAVNP